MVVCIYRCGNNSSQVMRMRWLDSTSFAFFSHGYHVAWLESLDPEGFTWLGCRLLCLCYRHVGSTRNLKTPTWRTNQAGKANVTNGQFTRKRAPVQLARMALWRNVHQLHIKKRGSSWKKLVGEITKGRELTALFSLYFPPTVHIHYFLFLTFHAC